MKKYLYTIILFITSYMSGIAAPGDDCSTAIAVSSNGCSAATAFDNTGITGTLAPPSCFTTGNNNGMWFQFVATTKIVNITVNGSSLTQPQIALLQPPATGCSGTFTELVCNSSGTAVATVNYSNLTIGNTYYIYIDGRNNLVGTFQLCLNSPIAPVNDNPCNPIIVPANNYCSGTDVFTNVGASSDNLISTSIPACWTTTGAYNTVYFQFTALGSYNAITVSGNLSSPQIAIISTANCNGTTWTNNGASNCASSNTNTVTMNANNLTVGQTYLIAVDGKVDNVGTFQLCVNSYAPTTGPSNDQCPGAISLCNGYASGSTVGATATNDINIGRWNCNGVLDNPVWFKFDAATPVQPVVLGLNGTCSGDALQVEVFRFTGASGPCTPANSNQFTSIGCDNTITGSGSSTLTIPAANMVAGQTYYILVDNWPGQTCNFSFTISGISATNAGLDQNLCVSQAPINLVGAPAGGTWSGTGITNPTLGTFNPQVAGIGTHVLYYTTANCFDEKIINVTGPQVVTSNDVSICGGSTQLTGSVNLYPQNSIVQFTNTTDYNIPDNNTTGVSSVISVSGVTPNTVATNPIQKVCMNIGHSYDGDLDVYLICPGGTQIELTTDNGGGGDGYTNTCFVASGTSITAGAAPFTGSFTPEQAFTNLNACNVNGNWTLKVVDDAGSDIGTLLDWSIYFNQQNSVNYVWSPTTNMTNSTTLNPTVSPTTNTTYYLTATDNNSCTAKDSVRVSIGGSIAGPDQNVCLTKSTTFASSGVGTWTPLATNPATVTIQSNTNPTSNVGPFNTAGIYNFEWNAGGCKDTVKITVNTPPVANAGLDKVLDCTTTSVQIGTPAVAGVTYTWSPTNGLSSSSIAQPTASQSGTFTVTATNTITGCFTTDAVTITQSATIPTANAGVDKVLNCTTTSVQIGTPAVAGVTYTWSPTNGLSSSVIAQPSASQTGTFTVTATDTDNGCTATDAVIISQDITPPVANAGADKTLTCSTTSVQIGTPAVAGVTYSWSPPTGLSSTAIAQPSASQPGTFTVTATDTANGCMATDAVTISRSGAFPIVNAGPDKILTCTVSNVTIGMTPVTGINYSWSPTNGLSNPNISQPIATQSGTFTLTAIDTINGCISTDAVTITQDITPPTANAGVDKSLTCSTTSVQIGTPAVAGVTYTWSPTNGLSSSVIAQPTASQPGTFTVTATNTANGCTATDAVTISQNITPPTANAGVDKTLTCTTTSVQIGTPAVTGVTYTWSPPNGLSSTVIAQPSASQPGTFTVTATNTANGCTATDAVIISQDITPPVANAGADKTLICSTTSVLIGTPAVAGVTYTWSPTNGLSSSVIAQPSASQTGTFTVTATNTANGCTATDAVTISQDITPPVANAGVDKTLTCTTTSVQIGAPALAGVTYTWSPTNGLSSSVIAQPSASQTGTFTVTATNTANGCTATDAVTISQDITPPVANAGVDKTLTCTTTSVQIGAPAVAGVTYTWSPTNGLSSSVIAQPSASQPGTFTVTATNTANGCKATNTVIVTIDTLKPIVNAGDDKLLTCSTPTVSIGSNAITGINYSWSPASGLIFGSVISKPDATLPNTYTITALNPVNGCVSTDDVTVSQNISKPLVDAGEDKTLTCTTNFITIGTPGIAGIKYTWTPAIGLNVNNIAQPTASDSGMYIVTALDPTNGCISIDTVAVLLNRPYTDLELGPDQTIYQEESATITATGAIASNSIIWTPTATLSCGNCITTIASPITTTSYFVSYTNTDKCITLDTITINVIPIVGLFFPSAFSPNGDGINDEFLALGDSVKTYELSIYNRWGELLFTTTDRYATWNGIFSGTEQPTDSYVYVAHATLYNNKKKDYKGTFSLLR